MNAGGKRRKKRRAPVIFNNPPDDAKQGSIYPTKVVEKVKNEFERVNEYARNGSKLQERTFGAGVAPMLGLVVLTLFGLVDDTLFQGLG